MNTPSYRTVYTYVGLSGVRHTGTVYHPDLMSARLRVGRSYAPGADVRIERRVRPGEWATVEA